MRHHPTLIARRSVDLAAKLGKMPATGGNRVDLIFDYIVAIDRLVADINGARHSIRILVYIFADDAVGRRVADALGRGGEARRHRAGHV